MLGFAGLALRQAQEALQNGRLEEAHRLLAQPAAQGLKGSWELLQQVARGFAERGERHLRNDDPTAAWNDLLQAEQVGAVESGAVRLRQALTRLGIMEVRSLLEAGEPARAGEVIVQLRSRSLRHSELPMLDEMAKNWTQAEELANRGEFAQALQVVERVRRLWPGRLAALEELYNGLTQRHQKLAEELVKLHEAVAHKRWRDVVPLAEQVLLLAPQHEAARKARTQAWKAIEPVTVSAPPCEHSRHTLQARPEPRFLLWIDGVGGYLVCLGNRVMLGQAVPDACVDIPIFADVSRLHATLTRDTEGYLLEAVRGLHVNGKAVDRALLQSGDRLTLGSACQIQFRQPVPVSASARLDLVSGHRLPVSVDGVLLMADTLVLGPGAHVHVPMPDLKEPVVLFRLKDGLGIRHAGNFSVDGLPCVERGTLRAKSTVSGEDFALAVETLGTRMGRT